MQKDEILKMVVALKAVKLPVSKIETELGFSNGLIGKAAKGETELSADKFEKLVAFFDKKMVNPPKKAAANNKITFQISMFLQVLYAKIIAQSSNRLETPARRH